MIARIAYLSTPAPGVYVLNLQCEGEEGIRRFEISKAHLANIVIDGASLALRANHLLDSSSVVEQGAVNAQVAGSNPAYPASINRVSETNSERRMTSHERAGAQ